MRSRVQWRIITCCVQRQCWPRLDSKWHWTSFSWRTVALHSETQLLQADMQRERVHHLFPGVFISVSVYSLADRQLIKSRLSAGLKQSSVCDDSTFLFAIVSCLKETCKISHRLLCVMAKFVLNRWKRLFKRHSSCCFKNNTLVQRCWSLCMMNYAPPLAFNPVITDFPSLNSSLEVLISLNNGQSFISSPITIYATTCVSTQYIF